MSAAEIHKPNQPDFPMMEELCLKHDQSCDLIRSAALSIEKQLAGNLDREDRRELASAFWDVAGELEELFEVKQQAGFFDGPDGANVRDQERLAHLKSDYRRLLNELRQVEHETETGKLSKARRLLSHWMSRFSDVCDRETDVISEIWKSESAT